MPESLPGGSSRAAEVEPIDLCAERVPLPTHCVTVRQYPAAHRDSSWSRMVVAVERPSDASAVGPADITVVADRTFPSSAARSAAAMLAAISGGA